MLALEAALELPIKKLAVYNPAISINGSVPIEWLPSFEQALADNDLQKAAFIILQGTHLFDPENFVTILTHLIKIVMRICSKKY